MTRDCRTCYIEYIVCRDRKSKNNKTHKKNKKSRRFEFEFEIEKFEHLSCKVKS